MTIRNGQIVTRVVDKFVDIAEEARADHVPIRVSGLNEVVNNTEETVWEVGGIYTYPSSDGIQLTINSDSTEDDPTGAGIRTLDLHYLDTAYAEQQESITLGGTSAITSSATDIRRIQNIHTLTAGSSATADGTIDFVSGGTTFAIISPGENTVRQALWTVPAEKTAFLTCWSVGVGNNQGGRFGRFELEATADFEGDYLKDIFVVKDIINIQDNAIAVPLCVPFSFPQKTDIQVRAVSDQVAANAIMSGRFDGWYE